MTMTFKEFCDEYPNFRVTYNNSGVYYFLVEKNNNKFIYCFNIDKKQYIKNNIVDGEVTKLRFRNFGSSSCVKYEDFLKIYDNYCGQIVICTSEGQIITPKVDDLHNYKYFYINGDMFHFSKDGSSIVESCDPIYKSEYYTKESFEDSIDENDLL